MKKDFGKIKNTLMLKNLRLSIFKKIVLKVLAIFIIILFLSFNQNKQQKSDLITIDVLKKYPLKNIYLQDIANVEYIRLETNLNTLLRDDLALKIVHISDDYIIASNTGDGDVFIFDGKGKIKNSFNKKGQHEKMEYRNITALTFIEKDKEIYICDIYSKKWFVYKENGEFLRSFDLNFSRLLPRNVYNFNDEMLLLV